MRPVILHCPQMQQVAERVKAALGGEADVWIVDWRRFENTWPDIFIPNARKLDGRRVIFLASFDTPGDALTQFFLVRALPFFTGANVLVSIPYFPTATKERMVKYGEIVTAKGLTEILSQAMPKYVKYELAIFDMHTKPGVTAFGDFVRPLYLSALPLLTERLRGMRDACICFPDKGAWTRFEEERELFIPWPFVRFDKERALGDRTFRLIDGDPAGRHAVIIDDLINTGGTVIECKNALKRDLGAAAVSVFATHGVFPEESWKKFLHEDFAHVWITDSCPKTESAVAGQGPFEILSLAPLIAQLAAPAEGGERR